MTRPVRVSRFVTLLLTLAFAPVLTGSCSNSRDFAKNSSAAGAGGADDSETAGRGGSEQGPPAGGPGVGGSTSGDGGVGVGVSGGEGGEGASDDCTGVVCDTPPASDCTSPTEFRAYDRTGSCSAGVCSYVAQDVSCTCEDHACTTDPCLGLACVTPPEPSCKDAEILTQYEPNGACDGGSCSYAPTDSKCEFGCANGQCNPDPCLGVACSTPPASVCVDGATFKAYDKVGSCSGGTCSYTSQNVACTCKSNACTTDPCIGITCGSPPATTCKDASTLTKYASSGTCSGGSCSYQATDSSCPFGCANAACKPDPCQGVTCNTQKSPICKDTTTAETYAASGTCSAGTCSYKATATSCGSNRLCGGAGVCSVCKVDTSCGATCAACGSTTPKCKDLGATSKCVGCLSNADCSGATPVCNATTNVCQARPSCVGLAKTCGPSGTADCCASSVVTGDTSNAFKRDNDPALLAKISTFRLDTYEITVGRFRTFLASYTKPVDGAGANPNNPSDPGWESAWNSTLVADAATLKPLLHCDNTYATWTDNKGLNEALPMNCITWLEAEAFCIWDGGRLPTDAEWNYAAAGGLKDRVYPWGSVAPDCSYANYLGMAGNDPCQPLPTRVGSLSPKGDGWYGQADLAGNLMEYTQDKSAFPRPVPCDNCADLSNDQFAARMVRGGGFTSYPTNITNNSHEAESGSVRLVYAGGRCARLP